MARGAGAERYAAYAVCGRGLEPFVADELRTLGVRVGRLGVGGVEFAATTRQLYAANLHLATATRVVVRVASFVARGFSELEAGAREIDWGARLPPRRGVRVAVRSSGSRLFHTDAIAQRIARIADEVLVERDGWVPADRTDEAQLVVVRVAHDRVTISIDSSGEPLHHRGWRLAGAKAPLRPTLAAALLTASGWDPSSGAALVDPFCGSGTILVEAARRAHGIAPGWGREFGFSRWPGFEPGTWASVQEDARRGHHLSPAGPIVGSDRDAGAIQAARANAERAGVLEDLDLREAAVSTLVEPGSIPTGPGFVVTNPPYGKRVGGEQGKDPRNLYSRTGDVLRAACPGWGVALLGPDPALVSELRLPLGDGGRVDHGGLRVHLFSGTVPGRRSAKKR